MATQSRYEERGVSADKNEVHAAIANMDHGIYPNAFCKVLPDMVGGDPIYCNVIHADTAGTKTALGYLQWKETGNLDVWRGIAQDAMIMNIDDLACVGITSGIVLSNTIGRNKHLIPGEVISRLIRATDDIIRELQPYGVQLSSGGGETADVGDVVRTLDVGYTAFARVHRSSIVDINIKPGAVAVGLASFGQATYESAYNSGIGSNGLTSARHDILSKTYLARYPESFSPESPESLVYCGSRKLSDPSAVPNVTIGDLLLSPTRTYAPVVKAILDKCRRQVQGMIHCSGGGQTKVIKFLKNMRVVKDNLFEAPPVFQLIQSESGTSWKEMYQVYNMGHRLEVFVDPSVANDIIVIANKFNIDARIIGYCESAEQPEVLIKSPQGEFLYQL